MIKQSDHLSEMQREELKALLTRYEILFDGKLGHWETKSVDIDQKEGAHLIMSGLILFLAL